MNGNKSNELEAELPSTALNPQMNVASSRIFKIDQMGNLDQNVQLTNDMTEHIQE